MLLDIKARGVYPIAPTPFHADGRVDFASIDRMTDFYREVGSTGMTVLGVMGEAPKLDGAEAVEVAARFVRRAEGLPVIVGVSAPGFAAMRGLARASMDAGAAGVMVAPPNTLRTDDQITGYYRQAGGDRRRHPLRHAGLPAELLGGDDAGSDPPHRRGEPVLRDAEARGLAGAGEDLGAAGLGGGGRAAARVHPLRQRRPVPRLRGGARRRRG